MKRRIMNKGTKRYVVRPNRNNRANLVIETGTYSRTNSLARDAPQEAEEEKKMEDTRTGVAEEGAA